MTSNILFASDDSSGREDVYFSNKRSSFQKREDNNSGNGRNRYRGKLNNQGFWGRGNKIRSGNNRYRGGNNNYNKNLPQTNPVDSEGEVSKCLVCGSVYHWAKDCPDSFEARTKGGTIHKFWLQEPYTAFIDESTESLTKETFNTAILDSGWRSLIGSVYGFIKRKIGCNSIGQ